jgi:hypothetical protein
MEACFLSDVFSRNLLENCWAAECPMVLWDNWTGTDDRWIVGMVVLISFQSDWVLIIFFSFPLLCIKVTFDVQVENITWASWSLEFGNVDTFAVFTEMGINKVFLITQ